MIHSKQKGQRYRRRQADDKDQHNEKEKAILGQGDNCDDQNRTCVVGPFNALFLGRKTHRAYQWSCNEALFSNNNYQYYGLLSRWATTIHKPRPWHKTEIQYAWFWDRTAIICNLQNFSELNNDWVSQKLLSKVPLKSRNLRALYSNLVHIDTQKSSLKGTWVLRNNFVPDFSFFSWHGLRLLPNKNNEVVASRKKRHSKINWRKNTPRVLCQK